MLELVLVLSPAISAEPVLARVSDPNVAKLVELDSADCRVFALTTLDPPTFADVAVIVPKVALLLVLDKALWMDCVTEPGPAPFSVVSAVVLADVDELTEDMDAFTGVNALWID